MHSAEKQIISMICAASKIKFPPLLAQPHLGIFQSRVLIEECTGCSVIEITVGMRFTYPYGFDQQRLIWYVFRLWDMVFS